MNAAKKPVWKRAAVIALIVLVAGVGIVFWMQRFVLFPRQATQPDDRIAAEIPGLERLWIDTPQGQVESWFLPGDGVSASAPGPAVIFAHGNAELIENWPRAMAPYRRMGVSVLLAEYRGYGRSAGSPSQARITDDFVRFYDRLTARPEVDETRIIFHGRSLGGGAVSALSTLRPPAAMILQSTFTSVTDMAAQFFVPGFMVMDPFDNLSAVSELAGPVLVVHGRYDSLIPHRHGERLAGAAAHGRLVTYASDHNDCPPQWPVFWQEVEGFLRGAEIVSTDRP